MNILTLTTAAHTTVTILSNDFIDHDMGNANGEYVKVYLYLLRCIQDRQTDLSISAIADRMHLTEADVTHALHYWEQCGRIQLLTDAAGNVCTIHLTDNTQPAPPPLQNAIDATASQAQANSQQEEASGQISATIEPDSSGSAHPAASATDPIVSEDLQELILIAEQYLKRPLTPVDVDKLVYFYEKLHFSQDLIEYLLEHCALIGNRSIRYIESVAVAWADKGIRTVREAKEEGQHYRREYFTIIKAFGIRNRNPIDSEVQYMRKWLDEYHFTTEVICEACQRTIANTGNPVFAYADTILRNWKEQGILAKRDIAILDQQHQQKQKQHAAKNSQTARQNTTSTKFNNFDQRSEYNFDELEKQLNQL